MSLLLIYNQQINTTNSHIHSPEPTLGILVSWVRPTHDTTTPSPGINICRSCKQTRRRGDQTPTSCILRALITIVYYQCHFHIKDMKTVLSAIFAIEVLT